MKKLTQTLLMTFVVAGALMLASCGGDGIGGTGYPLADIHSTPEGVMYRSDEESLSVYFQRAVKLQSNNKNGGQGQGSGPTISVADGGSEASGSGSLISSTNIQEAGLEEADLIKTNGRAIYSVTTTFATINGGGEASSTIKSDDPNEFSGVIRIMEPQNDGLVEVKRFTSKNLNYSGLYLHDKSDKLIALASGGQDYYTHWFDAGYFANQITDVVFVDVKKSTEASISTTLSFEGSLISSRRNEDTLYMVLRHYPDYQYVDDKTLLETKSEDFLPTYTVGDAAPKFISKAENCFLEKGRVDKTDIITLVAVDLASDSPEIKSQCFIGSAEAFYASQKALYLATTRWDYQINDGASIYPSAEITTDIHKFSYDGLNIDYRGSGEVSGHLGYKQDSKSFRFSESQDGLLRVITFDEDQWAVILPLEGDAISSRNIDNSVAKTGLEKKSPVSLTILKENPANKTLKEVSKLPNVTRPAPIGLPGERLYATRYIGDKAYVVTFRVIDPLYILDLSDPNDPFIAGELKVDGYSDYLHPISDSLILGVGKDAIPDDVSIDGRGAWYQGVKLSLIDVSSPSNPREVDKVILGKRGTEAGVLYDHHALTGLKVGSSHYRVAMPVRLHEEESILVGGGSPSTYNRFKHLGLYRFDINIDSQKIVVVPPMIIQDSRSSSVPEFHNDRSVFIDDKVHYMHDGDFWSQNWEGTGSITGPK